MRLQLGVTYAAILDSQTCFSPLVFKKGEREVGLERETLTGGLLYTLWLGEGLGVNLKLRYMPLMGIESIALNSNH